MSDGPRKFPDRIVRPPNTSSQKLNAFRRGNAMSSAPIMSGIK